MGWFLKLVALLLALVLVGAGAWALGLVIFAVLLVPPVLGLLRRRPRAEGESKPGGRLPGRYLLGGLLFLLACVAYASHGTLSPVVFASLGAAVVLWGRLRLVWGSGLRPVAETVLLRSSRVGGSWAAVAEVKAVTRDPVRALSGVVGTVVVSVSMAPAVYVVLQSRAWGARGAEEEILAGFREAARSMAPLGAYLLPLDSVQAAAVFRPSLQAARVREADLTSALSAGPYDLLAIGQERGFARSVALYRREGEGREGRANVPAPGSGLSHPPLLLEVFKAVGGRLDWQSPDGYTAFLSSLFATSREPVGTRVLDAGAPQSQAMLVRSQGSPAVELSKAQLRAVVRIYDQGGGARTR